jgi:diguanylate cyclase (GGDEF)-like protein/PAS domain S-box-containing protein
MQSQRKQSVEVTESTAAPAYDNAVASELSQLDSSVLVDALIARNPEPVVVLQWAAPDPASCPVVTINENLTHLTGFSPADMLGGTPELIKQIFATPSTKSRARNAVATGKSERISSSFTSKHGRELSVEATLIPIAGIAGQKGYLVLFLHDVTDLKHSADVGVSAEQDVRNILMSARCIVWHALVERRNEEYSWNYETANEEAARKWLPVDVEPGEKFFEAFVRSVHPEDRERIDKNCKASLDAGEFQYSQEFRCRLAGGEYRWVAEDVQIENLGSDNWRLIGVCIDITEQKKAKETVADERHLLRTLIDNVPDCIYFKDTKSRFIINNSYHARILEAEGPEKLAGKTDFDFFPYEVAAEYYMDELSIIQSGIPLIDKEERMTLPSGRKMWFLSTKVPLRDGAGNVIGLVGISRDITAQKQLEAEREQLLVEAIDRADRDPLTGLWNHRAFQKRLEEEADLAMARETSVAILVMDMDNFKFFNDAYGHTVGDDVLCEVARTLRAACRPEDTLARFGGDEFAVLMPLKDPAMAEHLAKKIAGSLDELGYRPQGFDAIVPIRVSWGVAVYPDEAPARLDALSLADGRLMRAKSGIGEAGELMERLSAQLSASVKGFNMLSALVNAVDNKDRYTRRHSEDVLLYALQIAIELGLDDATCHMIQVSALLHDVGKIGVPDHILRKPARLTPEEYESIKLHPTMGAIIVSSVKGFEEALPAVQYHHERWDGQGYPDGLAGEEIPLVARILAVADAFSAMTTDRPYRKGMSSKIALQILEEGAGTQWDADLVSAFVALRRRKAA